MTASPVESTALDLLCRIASSTAGVDFVQFVRLKFAPDIERRAALDSDDESVVMAARDLRARLKVPFWQAVMLAACGSDSVPAGVLSAAVYHQKLSSSLYRVPAREFTQGRVNELVSIASQSGELVAVTSLVSDEHGGMHLPLLDIHCAFTPTATEIVAQVLRLLECHGTLLCSGKSYHFYGDALINERELTRFLGRALLFDPIVDRAWIAHQLIERCCALRISAREGYGGPPIVVRSI
jgi:hypothetical protein